MSINSFLNVCGITITPGYTAKSASSTFLLISLTFNFFSFQNAFTFYATKGMIINGKIVPPISDAVITLTFPNNPTLVNLETRSDQSGAFKFGPFDGSLNVELTAFKESYVFSEYDKTNQLFKAHKLCEIIAVVRDEQKNLLSGVCC